MAGRNISRSTRECFASGGKAAGKMETTMHEFKHGDLRSGSKTGPVVTKRAQAIAIGLSQARKAGEE